VSAAHSEADIDATIRGGDPRLPQSKYIMRAFAWFLGAILLAGLIGACIAYPAYELSSSFANFAFHRVASRIFMLVLVLLLAWVCRQLNLRQKRDFGYGLPWRRFSQGMPAMGGHRHRHGERGCRVLAGHAPAGRGLGIRSLGFKRRAHFSRRLWPPASAVALIEETVFRGIMHSGVERESGPWMAALAHRTAVRRPAFHGQSADPGGRRGLGQRLRFVAALVRAPGPPGAGG